MDFSQECAGNDALDSVSVCGLEAGIAAVGQISAVLLPHQHGTDATHNGRTMAVRENYLK
jgi:hypothetical protein